MCLSAGARETHEAVVYVVICGPVAAVLLLTFSIQQRTRGDTTYNALIEQDHAEELIVNEGHASPRSSPAYVGHAEMAACSRDSASPALPWLVSTTARLLRL